MEQLKPIGFYTSDGLSSCGDMDLREAVTASAHPDESRIIEYLNQGVCVAYCGGYAPDYLNRSINIGLRMDLLTDGVWEWPAYLVYYVDKYHLHFPEAFLDHMRSNSWTVPEVSPSNLVGRIVYI